MVSVYLFPGQGSQQPQMGRALIERFPETKALYERADKFLGYSLSELCIDGSAEDLAQTDRQQPAMFVTELARWEALQVLKAPRADYLAGHSLGQITALAAGGSLSFYAALHLVRERGRIMHAASQRQAGSMMAVLGASAEQAQQLCAHASSETGELVVMSNDNSPVQQVISGTNAAIAAAEAAAKAFGIRKTVRLPISIASHCALMTEAAAEFAAIIEDVPVNTPRIPVLSNLTTLPFPAPRRIREELHMQLTQMVRWHESMLTLRERGVDTFIEVGPGDVLSKLMKRIDRGATRQTFEDYL